MKPECRAAPARSAGAIAALVLLFNLAVWFAFNPPLAAPDAPSRVAGLAYNAFQRWESPLSQRYPTETELAADIRLLAGLTGRLRTYSSAEFPALPALAQQHGLKVSGGVWLDRRLDNNEREIAAVIDAARRHPNIERVMAGNETQLHHTLSPAELMAYLDRLRAALPVPVSTAEPWHIWLRQPELAAHVDFITVHLLPYWEGVPMEAALDEALLRYGQIRARFPDQPVVIGEIGWPSGGDAVGAALATPAAQAAFVRGFLARAGTGALDYYLMEAVDQPWKRATEGPVGANWGLLDAARRPKFEFTGPIYAEPYWRTKALVSSALGLAAMLPFLLAFARMRLAGRLAFALSAQAVASFAVLLATLPLVHYLRPSDVAAFAVLVPALAVMASILLAQAFEFSELFWAGSLRHQAQPRTQAAGVPLPFVSIHLACSNEPPDMVIATIDSLLALDWPAFEILVIDNNTQDPVLWRPVQAHVQARMQAPQPSADPQALPHLRFVHLPDLAGLQGRCPELRPRTDRPTGGLGCGGRCRLSGAARLAARPVRVFRRPRRWHSPGASGASRLGRSAAPAHDELGVRRLLPYRHAPPPRTGCHSAARHHDADPGGDAPAPWWLGDRLRVRGHRTRAACPAGRAEGGLCGPRARHRPGPHRLCRLPAPAPALGARRHADPAPTRTRPFRPVASAPGSALSLCRRLAPWIGDALHLVFSLAAMAWTVGLVAAPQLFGVPFALFVVPLAVFFLARLVLGPLLYWRRVPCPTTDILGAALAGMGLSHTIARGVIAGLTRRRATFDVTPKGPTPVPAGPGQGQPDSAVRARSRRGGTAAGAAGLRGGAGAAPRTGRHRTGGLDDRPRDAVPALCRRTRVCDAIPRRSPTGPVAEVRASGLGPMGSSGLGQSPAVRMGSIESSAVVVSATPSA